MDAKDPSLYLLHMRDCCERIEECLAIRGRPDVPERMVLYAVCRNLEILGEAANKTGAEFRAAHPEIPWRKMVNARNVLIHNYEGTDPEIVWGIAAHDIPPLLAAVRRLLEEAKNLGVS